jgi:glucan biosynthesis protein
MARVDQGAIDRRQLPRRHHQVAQLAQSQTRDRVGDGAKLAYSTVQKNPNNGTWRVSFGLRADGSKRPVELRCFLRKTPHILTETWTYLWQP